MRRFIAPFTGTISIDADVALDSVGADSTDGVRVAIQHNGTELDDETLEPGGTTSAFGAPIPLAVTAGDRIYFRAGAIDDGVSDSVTGSPVITYQSPSWPATDANGLSQVVFSAAVRLHAGRPAAGLRRHAVHRRRAQVDASVVTSAPLTDELTVVAVKRDPERRRDAVRPRHDPGGHGAGHASRSRQQIPVAVTESPTPTIRRSPTSWPTSCRCTSPSTRRSTSPTSTSRRRSPTRRSRDATGNEEFEHHVRPHVEIYPYANTHDGPSPDAP